MTERVDPAVGGGRGGPSPELVGGIAAAIVIALVGVYLLSSVGGRAGTASPTASTAVGSTTPSPSPSLAVDPAVADLLGVVNARLLRSAEQLSAALDHDPFRTADVSTLVRELNATARFGRDAVGDLDTAPAAADLAGRLSDLYTALGSIATDTLAASITNAAAYRTGATRLVAELKRLPALQAELDRLRAGVPAGSAAPTGPTASAGPVATPSAAATPPRATASPTPVPSPSPSTAASATPPGSGTPTGPSQVVDGGFESGVGPPWSLRLGPSASATIAADTEVVASGKTAARIDITAPSEAYVGVVLRQPGIRLEAGANYEIRVALRSAAVREIRVQVVSQAGEAYVARLATALPGWSVATFAFTAPASDEDAVLEFALGRSDITTWLDDVYLGPPGPSPAP